ncbi:42193_t:CDS:2 [Gigaspora margarita]|uniref:42193_t:CDS:1 n=1 Tax=Gigaspora margarita TaxID=4874 RepID=A0ABN7VEH9_GIGMA|nr:42193_t:CDS:2 [Gigaspora margarita]
MKILQNITRENVNLYLDKIVLQMEIQYSKNVSISTMCCIKQQRNELLCSAFMPRIGSQYKSSQVVFLDKSSKDERTNSWEYGYSEMNSRSVKKVVFLHGKRYILLPTLTLDGIIAVDIIESSYS